MAETTVLKSSASPKQTDPRKATAHAQLSGAIPTVNVTMGSGGKPQVQGKDSLSGKPNVQVFPVRGALGGQGSGGAAASADALAAASRSRHAPVIVDHRNGKPSVQRPKILTSQPTTQVIPDTKAAPIRATRTAVHASALTFDSDQLSLLRYLVGEYTANAEGDAGELAKRTAAMLDRALALKASEPASPPMRRVMSSGPTTKISASAAPRRSVVQDVHVPPVEAQEIPSENPIAELEIEPVGDASELDLDVGADPELA